MLHKKMGVYALCCILFNFVVAFYYMVVLPDVTVLSYLFSKATIGSLSLGSLLIFTTNFLGVFLTMPMGRYIGPVFIYLTASSEVFDLLLESGKFLSLDAAFNKSLGYAIGSALLFVLCFIPYRRYKKRVDPSNPSRKAQSAFDKLHGGKADGGEG